MRAVNLIPQDQRRGADTDRSGGAVYVLLAALAVIALASALYVVTGNEVSERRGELAQITSEAATVEAKASDLSSFKEFAALSEQRSETVAALAASRFDWDHALRKLARTIPPGVSLTSLIATVAPGVTFEDGASGGETSALRPILSAPAVEIVGCARNQFEVSRFTARLRLIRGVTRVSLAASEKATGTSAGSEGTAGTSSSDCRGNSIRVPQFQIVIFFEQSAAAKDGATVRPAASSDQAPVGGAAQ